MVEKMKIGTGKKRLVKDLFNEIKAKNEAGSTMQGYIYPRERKLLAELYKGEGNQEAKIQELQNILNKQKFFANLPDNEKINIQKKNLTKEDIKDLYKEIIKSRWKADLKYGVSLEKSQLQQYAGFYDDSLVRNMVRLELLRKGGSADIPVTVGTLNLSAGDTQKANNDFDHALSVAKKDLEEGKCNSYTILSPVLYDKHWRSLMIKVTKEENQGYKVEIKCHDSIADEKTTESKKAESEKIAQVIESKLKKHLGNDLSLDNQEEFKRQYIQQDGVSCGLIAAQALVNEYFKSNESKEKLGKHVDEEGIEKYMDHLEEVFQQEDISKKLDKLIETELEPTKKLQKNVEKLHTLEEKLSKEGSLSKADKKLLQKIINANKEAMTSNASYYGLGAEVEETKEGYFKITKIYEGSSLAKNAKVGDIITKIGDQDLSKLKSLDDKVALAREDLTGNLTIKTENQMNKGEELTKEVKISRKIFTPPSSQQEQGQAYERKTPKVPAR